MIVEIGEIAKNILQTMFWSPYTAVAIVCALVVHYKTNKGKWWIWNMKGAGLRMLVWEFIFCTGALQFLYNLGLYFRDQVNGMTQVYTIIWLITAVIGGFLMILEYKT